MSNLSTMDMERWQQIDALLQAALERPPAERASFLSEACTGDESLRKEVESLLSSGEQPLSLLDKPAFEAAAGLFEQGESELQAGQSFGRFEILSLLGAGGMGEVYLARDLKLGRKIAIKLLPVAHSFNKERLHRFQQEARAASALNHPNIITIHEVGESQGRHFIATEFIEGKTLRHLLRRSKLSLPKAVEVAIQAASALAAAHEIGIVHRDIKPENIMLRPDGFVKVLDFGLAQLSNPQSFTTGSEELDTDNIVTAPGLLLGTVNYMSPEQARGQKLDARSDIFSLGVVLYEMINGEPPFQGETPGDLLAAILKTEPLPLTVRIMGLPADLQRIVSKALRKDREERYQTIKDLLVDLKGLKRDLDQSTTFGAATVPTDRSDSGDRVSATTGKLGIRTALSAAYLTDELKRHKAAAAFTLVMPVVIAAIAFMLLKPGKHQTSASHFQNIKVNSITNSGKAYNAAISPDGRYLGFLTNDVGQQKLWIQQVATGSKVEVGPLAPGLWLDGLSFSPDGTYLYYVGKGGDDPAPSVYRIPAFGGPAQKVITGVDSPVSLSADGKRLAFVRNSPEGSALIVANADGSDEKQVSTCQNPDFFWGVGLSSDGAKIACAGMRKGSKGLEAKVIEVEVRNGAEKIVTDQRWNWINEVLWLHDDSGLIIAAKDKQEGAIQLWFISYPDGQTRRITTDLNQYGNISLTADSNTLAVTQGIPMENLWVVRDGDAGHAEKITAGPNTGDGMYGLCWTPDGRIVYSSSANGSQEIWIADSDGRNQRQLTTNSGLTNGLSVSPDGHYIVYVADQDGDRGIWRVNIDGSNPKQLTHGGGAAPYCSTDSKWVFFHKGEVGNRITWKVPINGGDAAQVSELPPEMLGFSPDGKLALYIDSQNQATKRMGILPASGGGPTRFYDLPGIAWRIQWMPDGRGLTYADLRKNVWVYPLDSGQSRKVTTFKDMIIDYFAWSPDGKRVTVALRSMSSDVVLISQLK